MPEQSSLSDHHAEQEPDSDLTDMEVSRPKLIPVLDLDAVISIDGNNRIQSWNKKAAGTVGSSPP